MADEAESRSPRSRLRLAARGAALAAAVVLAAGVLPWQDALVAVPAASPFVAAASALATRTLGVLALVAVPVLLLALAVRRGFCRWACPVGLVSETLGRLRRGKGPRLARWPAVGQWVLLATLGGGCLGYPLLVWLDPLAMLAAALGLPFRAVGWAAVLTAAPLAAVLAVSVLAPGAWCGRLCPLGGMQDVLALATPWLLRRRTKPAARSNMQNVSRARRVSVPAAQASRASLPRGGCGDPPRESAGGRSNSDNPSDPAESGGVSADGAGAARAVARRIFLGVGAGGVVALVTEAAGRGASPPVRPPGAADEDRFVGLCIRCGNCVRACPSGILKGDLGRAGVAGFLAPRVDFSAGWCRDDCTACGEVCPSGAIARLALAQKRRRVMGIAVVDLDKCVLAGGQECSVCTAACPYQAVEVVEPEPGAAFPAYPYPRVVAGACVGCGACEFECPTAPPRAIRVVPDAGTLADRV